MIPALLLPSLLLTLLLPVTVTAGQPRLELTAPQSTVQVGERLPVRIVAGEAGTGSWQDRELRAAVGPDQAQPWAVLEPPRPIAGAQPPAWQLVLAALRTGELALPEIEVQAPGEQPVPVRATDRVTVTSALPAGDSLIPAPLRAPVGAPGPAWEWLLPITLLLTPVLVVAGLWLRRSRDAGGPGRAGDPLTQLEQRLAALAADDDLAPAAVCDQLAAGLRCYLEQRTGAPFLEMTTAELLAAAGGQPWPEPALLHLRSTLTLADRVRFARQAVAGDELRGAIAAARTAARLIEARLQETTPAATPPAAETVH